MDATNHVIYMLLLLVRFTYCVSIPDKNNLNSKNDTVRLSTPGKVTMHKPDTSNPPSDTAIQFVTNKNTLQWNINNHCRIQVLNITPLYKNIAKMINEAVHLIEFKLNFAEYKDAERHEIWNDSFLYQPEVLYRAYSNHGKTLLTLAFNYDVMSLFTLTFGVAQLNVNMTASPKGCMKHLSEDKLLDNILKLVYNDFGLTSTLSMSKPAGYACHETIKRVGFQGRFQSRCCQMWRDGYLYCEYNQPNVWLGVLNYLLAVTKCVLLFFAPLILKWMLRSESLLTTNYTVNLNKHQSLTKTIMKVIHTKPNETRTSSMEQLLTESIHRANKLKVNEFGKTLETVEFGAVTGVKISKLRVQVDHKRLISEQSVPVGIFRFIYENLFRCRIQKWRAFIQCCQTSIFIPGHGNKDNTECMKHPVFQLIAMFKWKNLADMIGVLLLFITIPVPFTVRLVLYYSFENDEVQSRWNSLQADGLSSTYQFNILHFLTPTHWSLVIMYTMYCMSFIGLVICSILRQDMLINIAVSCIQDMNDLSKTLYFEMLVSQMMMPLRTFGIYGLLVGPFIWLFTIPLSLLIYISYCVPSIYLCGRFLIHKTPDIIDDILPGGKGRSRHKRNIFKINSVGDLTASQDLLHKIEDDTEQDKSSQTYESGSGSMPDLVLNIIIRIMCMLLTVCILVMVAEVLGFLLEICVFTLMGAIVNATNASNYIILAFWVILYSSSCFNNMYQQYMDLNKEIFSCIQDNLKDAITGAIQKETAIEKNIAFKYDINGFDKSKDKHTDDKDTQVENETNEMNLDYTDKLEYENQLQWKTKGLVLFLDNGNTPRIPRKLFRKVCNIRAPGCPGPIYQGMLHAIKNLLYMVLFLLFVVVVLMAFGTVYKVSSSNQVLMTLAGGFLPFIVKYILRRKEKKLSVGKFAFNGKLHNAIKTFAQKWPVHDLPFEIVTKEIKDEIKTPTTDDDMKDATTPSDMSKLIFETGVAGSATTLTINGVSYVRLTNDNESVRDQAPSCNLHLTIPGGGLSSDENRNNINQDQNSKPTNSTFLTSVTPGADVHTNMSSPVFTSSATKESADGRFDSSLASNILTPGTDIIDEHCVSPPASYITTLGEDTYGDSSTLLHGNGIDNVHELDYVDGMSQFFIRKEKPPTGFLPDSEDNLNQTADLVIRVVDRMDNPDNDINNTKNYFACLQNTKSLPALRRLTSILNNPLKAMKPCHTHDIYSDQNLCLQLDTSLGILAVCPDPYQIEAEAKV